MDSSLKLSAQNLLDSLNNNEDKIVIFENWIKFSSLINSYKSFDCIPYFYEVPIAMYQYVMRYTSKVADDNAIRAVNTFGILMEAYSNGDTSRKGDFLICLSLLLSRYKSYFLNSNYYAIFPIAKPKVTEYLNQTVKDYGNTKANFDAIKLYIINEIKSNYLHQVDVSLLKDFEQDCEKFYEEYKDASYDKSQMPDGLDVLWECFNDMLYIRKRSIYTSSSNNTEIYNLTRGLIQNNFTFFTSKYSLRDTSGKRFEERLSTIIDISISNRNLIIKNQGLDDNYLKSELSLPIKESVVRRIEDYVEFSFEGCNYKLGERDNIPLSMEIRFDRLGIKSIMFTFIVGEIGYLRHLEIIGSAN